MNKFKVGDRVRVVDKTLLYYGKVGIVFEKRDKDIYDVAFEFNEKEKFRYLVDELELVKEKESNMEFTLKDLTDDMIVEIRNGSKHLVVSNGKVMTRINGWGDLDKYENDLTHKNFEQLNIDKVWKIKNKSFYRTTLKNILSNEYIDNCSKYEIELVYDRTKPLPKKMTLSQICDELGYDVEIVKEIKE